MDGTLVLAHMPVKHFCAASSDFLEGAPYACTTPSPDEPGGGDSGAKLACRDFYDVARNIDLMNDAELRERLQDIWNTAEVSETPGIAESAREMLAGMTSGDSDQLSEGVDGMAAACEDVEPL